MDYSVSELVCKIKGTQRLLRISMKTSVLNFPVKGNPRYRRTANWRKREIWKAIFEAVGDSTFLKSLNPSLLGQGRFQQQQVKQLILQFACICGERPLLSVCSFSAIIFHLVLPPLEVKLAQHPLPQDRVVPPKQRKGVLGFENLGCWVSTVNM